MNTLLYTGQKLTTYALTLQACTQQRILLGVNIQYEIRKCHYFFKRGP